MIKFFTYLRNWFNPVNFFLVLVLFSSAELLAQSPTNYTATGTFSPPAGVTSVDVLAIGGGGRGGSSAKALGSRGGGGAGGAAAKKTALSVTNGSSYTVTVGSGGTTDGQAGGASWFSSVSTVYAEGGAAGSTSTNGTAAAGASGSSANSIGDVVYRGGNGGTGAYPGSSGGGGGGAGNTANGGNATGATAGTGNSPGGNGAAGAAQNQNGAAGSTYGGAGSGGAAQDGGMNNAKVGGNGADGYVSVSFTCPTYGFTSISASEICTSPGTSTVTLTNSTVANLPVGTYTVTYSRSSPSATGLTASMTVSTAGTGTFTATGLTTAGSATITVTNIASGAAATGLCTTAISASNTVTKTVGSPVAAITGTSATGACSATGTSTVTLTNSTPANLPVGSYTVTYNTSSPSQTGLTATLTVGTAGSGTFTATGLTTVGSSTITVTNISTATCTRSLSGNNTATISVRTTLGEVTGTSATNACTATGTSTVTLTNSTAANLPVGSYTATYNTSSPVQTGLSATLTVSTAGTGTFTATGLTTAGASTITVTSITNTCGNTSLSANNTADVNVSANPVAITGTSATNACQLVGTSTVTLTNSTAANLPVGSYTVTYNTTAPVQSGKSATLTVSTDGTGTFTATGLTTAGSSTITVTAITNSSSCSTSLSANNTASITVVAEPNINSTSATSACTATGTSTVTLSHSTTSNLPVGTYTVTYGTSSPAQSGLTATLTVSTAGTGTFTASGLISEGSSTITVSSIVLQGGSCSRTLNASNTATITVGTPITAQPPDRTISYGSNTTFTATVGGTNTYNWQVSTDGGTTYTDITNGGIYTNATTTTLNLAAPGQSYSGYYYRLKISSTTCSTTTYTNAGLLTVNCPYALTSFTAADGCFGTNSSLFTLTAANNTALPTSVASYTITYNIGAPFNVTGATASMTSTSSGAQRVGTFTVTGLSQIGTATATITSISSGPSGCTSTLSANNTDPLTISGITAQPQNASVTYNGNATFSVTAAGTTPSYQWQVSTNGGTTWTSLTSDTQTTGTTYSGRTSATLTLTSPLPSLNNYKYRVLVTVTSGSCSYTSDAATLSVVCPTSPITTQPMDSTINVYDGATFSVVAQDFGQTYVWQVSSNGGTSWTSITSATTTTGVTYSGFNSSTLTLTSVSYTLNGYKFKCVISGGGTCIYLSDPATLTVVCQAGTPTVADQTITYGSNATFSASLTGNNTYQWQYRTPSDTTWIDLSNDALYAGVTTASLTLTTPTQTYSGYQYRLIVTNNDCNIVSQSTAATLTVNCPYSLSAFAVGDICSTTTNSTFTLTQATTAANLPNGTYTVTYNIGAPYSVSGATASMTVSATGGAAGVRGGSFSVGSLSTAGNPTATITSIASSGCTSALVSNNTDAFYVSGISTQPANTTVTYQNNATFSVVAEGAGLTYQWQVSTNSGSSWANVGAGTSGGTTSTLTVTNPTSTSSGYQYKALVTATGCAQISSNAAILTVNCPAAATYITTMPSNQTVTYNGNATFTAVGTSPFGSNTYTTGYAWQYSSDGGSTYTTLTLATGTGSSGTGTLSGVTYTVTATGNSTTRNYSLVFTSPTKTLSGYLFRLTSIAGGCTINSTAATLTVDCPVNPITTQPSAASTALFGNTSFTVASGSLFTTYKWQISSDNVNWSDITSATTTTGVTYSNWTTATLGLTNVSLLSLNGSYYRVVVSGGGCTYNSNSVQLTVTCGSGLTPTLSNQTITYGANATFSASSATGNNTFKWQYSDDSGFTWYDLTETAPYSGVTTNTLTITAPGASYSGYLYKVIITNTDCSLVTESSAGSLTVNCPYSLSGFLAATICSPTTSSTFTLTQTSGANLPDGTYTVTYDIGSPYSVSNATASMTVSATGGAGGARGGSFSVTNLTTLGNPTATIKSIASTGCTKVQLASNTSSFYVSGISTQPVDATITYQSNATFSVVAQGASLTYQWQVSTNSGSTWANVGAGTSGGTTSTLTVTNPTTTSSGYKYRVNVSATGCSTFTSDEVTLTVNCPLAANIITAQPSDATVTYNANASFSITSTSPFTTYQWQVSSDAGANWADLTSNTQTTGTTYSGRTGATLTLTAPVGSLSGYQYRMKLISGGCTLYSNAATLTVNCPYTISSTSATNVTCTASSTSSTVTLSATPISGLANGTYTITYNTSVPSQTGLTASMTVAGGTGSGTFTATGLNVGGSSTITVTNIATTNCSKPISSNNTATITVTTPPVISSQPVDRSISYGDNTSFSVTATGATAYQWQVSTNLGSTYNNITNNSVYSGATTSTLTVTFPTLTYSTYRYRVVITGSCSSTTSTAGILTVGKRVIAIKADQKTKQYGDADPTLTYQITSGNLIGSDAFTGALTRNAGEAPGNYLINQGTVALSSNYTLNYTADTLKITNRAITVAATGATKIYGNSDPTFSYTVTAGSLKSGESFTGALSRASGESVGTYAMTIGTLTVNSYYTITFVPADFTITTRSITVTAAAKSKTYGASDPALTYSITTGSLAFTDNFSGALDREPGEAVGTYLIRQNTLALDSNYVLTYVGANFTIGQRAITVTADAKSKTYGDSDPALTYTITSGSLVGADAFTGALTRVTGEDVGTYAINQGTLALTSNYNLSYVSANLTITTRAITISADAKSKTYGDSDPALTYQLTSGTLAFTDVLLGALARVTGENVGTYAINQGTVLVYQGATDVSANYAITYNSADLTITQRSVTVTADALSKIYGNADPTLTYAVTSGNVITGDAFTGTLTRATGQDVGTYAISQGTLSLGSNYLLSFVGANFTITTRSITATADAKIKSYGDSDPALTYQITSGTLAYTDAFTGALTRVSGEATGTYAIQQGTLALSSNYVLTYVGADLTIVNRLIHVTAAAKTKVYGETDPTLTYTYTGTLLGSDAFSGAIVRSTGENVGSYSISIGTLALSSYYTVTFDTAVFSITTRPVTITAAAKTKVYGDSDPALTYTITSGTLVNGDTETGALVRVTGENVGAYAINQGTLAISANYAITFVVDSLTITTRQVTITADSKTKIYGDTDPALTYQITSGNLISPDNFSGALSRATGEAVGVYAINKGTVSLGSNYNLSYLGANLTITERSLSVKADAKTKIYGDNDPALTYSIVSGSLAAGDTLSGALSREVGEIVGSYTINQGTLSASSNYTFVYDTGLFEITPRPITATADAKSKVYGNSDPALTYTVTTGSLVNADAFSGSLTRAIGEDVGTYAINQGTLALSSNYTLSYVGANLTIGTRAVTVAADTLTKVYGDNDPALTYAVTSGSVLPADAFTGALSRVTGENIGVYAINQNNLALSSNYALTFVGADLTITTRSIIVTADSVSRQYGDTDPALTYTHTGTLAFTDAFSGSLARATGENVGTYSINQGTLTLSGNYDLSFVSDLFTIVPREITVTADPKEKLGGQVDPALTYQITAGSLAFSDTFSGSLTRVPGETLGSYTILIGTLSLSSNYNITYNNAQFSIGLRSVTVTANAKTKVYGDTDPALDYQITSGSLLPGDSFTGNITRTAGENVGTHSITQGTLALGLSYALTFVPADLTITQATLTVTANDNTRIYGDVDPAFTLYYSGFKFSDDSTMIDTPPTVTTAATSTSAVGTYSLVPGSGLDNNYDFTYVDGTFTITKATLTATADNKSRVYGDANPAFTISYSGFKNGETSAVLDTLATATSAAIATSAAGTYAITPANGADNNYAFSNVDGTLTINKATLTATADNKSRAYGDANPTFTISYTGFKNSETDSVIDTPPTASTTAGLLSLLGDYPITLAGGLDNNYDFTLVNGTLTIGKATLTVTADNKSRNYGSANPTLTLSYAGFRNGQTVTNLLTAPTASTVATTSSAVGTYSIVPANGSDANYNFTYLNGTLTVDKATLTTTADNQTRVYGDADPAFTISYTGFQNGENASAIDTAPTAATSATVTSAVGNYDIVPSGGLDNNYTFSYVNGTLNITKATLTATADNQSRVYGDVNPTLTITYSGFKNSETSSVIDTAPTATTAAIASSPVGTYSIVPAGGTDNNYAFSYVNGTLSVTKALLTATADNKSRAYGDANPTFTISYSGFKNSETASVIDTPPTGSTTATSTSVVGTYSIVPAGGSDNNYSFSYVNGTLTINQASIVATADNVSRAYGDANPTFTVSYTGLKNGEIASVIDVAPNLSTTATETSPVGPYNIVPSGGSDANYVISSYVNGTLTITKAVLTATADDKSRAYGDVNPAFTITYTGFKNSETSSVIDTPPTASTTAVLTSNVGLYPITPSGGLDNNYTFSFVNGTLTVGKAVLTATAADKSRAYGDANPVFTFNYTGFKNSETASVIDTPPTATTTATLTSNVGTYSIVPTGGLDNNYSFTFVNGTLTVTQATIVATADNATRAYGDADPTFTISYTGLKNGETGTVIDVAPTAVSNALATSPVGTYSITPSGGSDSNYIITYANGTLTVTKATLLITADNLSRIYGDANPTLTITYSGFKNSETSAVIDVLSTATTVATTASAVGTYPIVPAGGSDNNYAFSYVNGVLTVTQATIVATAVNTSRAYGVANPVFIITYSGFKNGQSSSILAVPPTGSTTATLTSGVGNYPIIPAGGSDPNYTFSYVNGTLTVTQATLTVTANNQTRTYGSSNPLFTVTYTGFKNGETEAVLTTQPRVTSTATVTSVVGTYPIVPAAGLDDNYALQYVNGTLTVTKAVLTATANSTSRAYGDANQAFTISYSGFQNAENESVIDVPPTVTTTATVLSGVGDYTLSIAGGSDNNYSFTYVDGLYTIVERPVEITAASLSKTYGFTDPVLTYNVSSGSIVNGDLSTGLLTRDPGENIGQYAISQGTFSLGANYSITFIGANFTIDPRIITVTALSGQNKIFGMSDPASFTYNVTGDLAFADILDGILDRTPGEQTGSYPIGLGSLTVIDGNTLQNVVNNYLINFVSANFTILQNFTTMSQSVSPSDVYYLDQVTFTATVQPSLIGASLTGYIEFFVGDVSYGTADIQAVPNDPYGRVTASLTATMETLPGTYLLTSVYTSLDNNYQGSSVTETNFIVKSRSATTIAGAKSLYTGNLFVYTSSSNSTSANVLLSASIKDNAAVGKDVRNAFVTFFEVDANGAMTPISGAENLPVSLINSNDLTAGSASATVSLGTGTGNAASYRVAVGVTGSHLNNVYAPEAQALVTVSKPFEFKYIVGGGEFSNARSSGILKGMNEINSSYQYDLKYFFKGARPTGKVKLVIPSMYSASGQLDSKPHVYVVTSNTVTTLKASNYKAVVSANVTITEIDTDGITHPVDADAALTFTVVKRLADGEQLAVMLRRKSGGIWYSSFSGGITQTQTPETRSYIKVPVPEPRFRTTEDEVVSPAAGRSVQAYPNPTNGAFQMYLNGYNNGGAVIRVIDFRGIEIHQREIEVKSESEIVNMDISNHSNGVYVIQVIQNGKSEATRVIKY